MMSTIKVLLWLFCGATARGLNRNIQSANLRSPQPVAVKQEQQSFHEPLTWRFPDPPAEEESQYPPDFELKTPTAVNSISATCGAESVWVEVKKDLMGIGKPVLTADVSLGGCPATGEDPNTQVLVFESELHGCGSQLLMSEDSFIYVFTLIYTPSPLGDTPIVRTRDVSVNIQCHYQRKHAVSTGMMKPTWNPFSDTKSAEENLYFSLKLMTDDWQYPRPSNQFLLGDMMKFKVSVKQFHHVPLRVFVDSCVATVVPNIDTVPRYLFMGNKGCLFDGQLTSSNSKFLPQTYSDELQFEVEAFKFQQDHSGVIYITCSLKATAATAAVDATNKACSFSNRWSEASGINQACSCCDADCGTGGQSQLSRGDPVLEQETAVGPIVVKDKPLR
ncbi:zona pellucida sperm-binding protein 3-like [Hippoglossus hippoglossus]|uniref:zona pellucida sperm-binding protein 3-like n=1 Tax=Hippoglossus hippoglossus TaxID=8267 RepID=UPI00148D3A47|nr:zona pellucida sperm-binding protein 3-like [Hippoglossus hippoglossus]